MKATYCLAIDLVDSTAAGQSRSTIENDRFNRALVAHLGGYIRVANLARTLIKFEGDGWLIMTKDVDLVPALCCVALALRDHFESQIARLLADASQRRRAARPFIPSLRIALCCGLDSEVLLPTGLPDFIGDSARLATRAAKFCRKNEVLVDDSVRNINPRDFTYTKDIVQRRKAKVGKPIHCQAPRQLFVLASLSEAGRGTKRLRDLSEALSRIHAADPTQPSRGRHLPEELEMMEMDVDFDVVWGRLDGERNPPTKPIVTAKLPTEVFVPPLALADDSWRALFWSFDDAASTGRQLYFKRLGRVHSWEGSDDTLSMTLQHTCYAHFLATNLNLQLPPSGKPHAILERIEELVGDDRLARQVFLASPLNVLAAVVSIDGVLLAPRRGDQLKERPGTLQTSVGGFWEWQDGTSPLRTLQREAEEELGLAIAEHEVEFVAFGFNGQTGEPDLLAVVQSGRSRQDIYDGWHAKTQGNSLTAEVSLDPRRLSLEVNVKDVDPDSLVQFIQKWRRKELWSQPSDRASILTALTRCVARDSLRQAFLTSVGRA
jgi:class 3 adenylate cyclase